MRAGATHQRSLHHATFDAVAMSPGLISANCTPARIGEHARRGRSDCVGAIAAVQVRVNDAVVVEADVGELRTPRANPFARMFSATVPRRSSVLMYPRSSMPPVLSRSIRLLYLPPRSVDQQIGTLDSASPRESFT